jgi:hypothetical protein
MFDEREPSPHGDASPRTGKLFFTVSIETFTQCERRASYPAPPSVEETAKTNAVEVLRARVN